VQNNHACNHSARRSNVLHHSVHPCNGQRRRNVHRYNAPRRLNVLRRHARSKGRNITGKIFPVAGSFWQDSA